ncbi:WD40 repeat domain-containing protein [Nonomuraea sp. NPDC049480]|uniref:WD40 repeat domain-containing protein n=1 Tax=Nonomuraea sp. NPDC049480 TaxID=3364353 RepID=UPI0037B77404
MGIWDVADASLRHTLRIGDADLLDLHVVDSGPAGRMVTQDLEGRVSGWSLPIGRHVTDFSASRTYSMYGGRLADGRHVLLTDGGDLSLWDLDGGGRLSMRIPPDLGTVRRTLLSTTDGRDLVTVIEERGSIVTFDPATGARTSVDITAHLNRHPHGLMDMWSDSYPYPRLATMSGRLAVPTPWRVRLWDLSTSQQQDPPLAWPASRAAVRAVRWQDRDLLLTSSAYEGVVALWDLDRPVDPEPGHDERISAVSSAESADVVASVDEGGTIVVRHSLDGRPLAAPLKSGVDGTRAAAVWLDGDDAIVATGAGSRYLKDGNLRRWNLSSHLPLGAPIFAHPTSVHGLSHIVLRGREVIVTFGRDGRIKIWHPTDGILLDEAQTAVITRITGFATGVIDGRPFAALSGYGRPMTLHALDDLTAPSITIPDADDDVVLAFAGPGVVAAHTVPGHGRPDTVRVWSVSGTRIGPDIRGTTEVTTATERAWPAVYVGRADGTISLTDLETGHDLCHPIILPTRPIALVVTGDGDLIAGFGSDLARVRPPSTSHGPR